MDEPTPLDPEELRARIAARTAVEEETLKRQYSLIRPLMSAATNYIAQVRDDDRFFLGFPEIDRMTRGHGRGELTYVTGRPHSGKTQVVLNAINNNSDKHIIVFTPDESPEIILSKLIAIRHGISSEELERDVKAGEPEAIDLIEYAAKVDFKNLLVVDQGLTTRQMGQALDEAEDHWGAPCDLAVYDFLELLPGDSGFNGVAAKSQAMKRWTKEANVPMLCMHQGKKGDGNRGQGQGMDGMRFGGDAEAIMVLEVYRKRDDKSLTDFERMGHQNFVTVDLVKNKRPPMQLGERDLYMDPDTGHVRTATGVDRVRDGGPTRNADEMFAARNA